MTTNELKLLHTAERREEVIVQDLLEEGANIQVINNYNETPLFLASMNGYDMVIKLLLVNKGVDPKPKND
jgi:ankyrin repeat protein